jgi:Fic family protein
MNIESIQKSNAGRLVTIGSEQTAYWAFVPHPLPPDLPVDMELMHELSDAFYALGELAGLGRMVPNPHLLVQPFMRREAVLSSRIEGTQTNLRDLYAYEEQQRLFPFTKSTTPESDAREVLNYVKAMEFGLERLNTLPVCLRLIRELHERLMEGVRGGYAGPGEFRRTQNWIGPPGSTLNNAGFVPPLVPEMHDALSAFERYLHEDNSYPPLVRLALIHYQFEAIHPFNDGNGRIGRLLISLLMVHWKLLPLPLLYLSAFFENHREEYYDRLQAVSVDGAWFEWVVFFLRGVTEQSRDTIDRIKQLLDLQQEWRHRLTQTGRSTLPMQLMETLFEFPILSIPRAERLLDITYPTAKRHVDRLVAEGILTQAGDASYGKVFVAEDILRILGE